MTARLPRPSDVPGSRPPVVMCNEPGSFAWGVLHRRHPALIEQVRDAIPYPPRQQRALDALLAEITNGVVEPLAATAKDSRALGGPGRAVLRTVVVRRALPVGGELLLPQTPRGPRLLHAGPLAGHRPLRPLQGRRTAGSAVDEELRRARPPRRTARRRNRTATLLLVLPLGQPCRPRLPTVRGRRRDWRTGAGTRRRRLGRALESSLPGARHGLSWSPTTRARTAPRPRPRRPPAHHAGGRPRSSCTSSRTRTTSPTPPPPTPWPASTA